MFIITWNVFGFKHAKTKSFQIKTRMWIPARSVGSWRFTCPSTFGTTWGITLIKDLSHKIKSLKRMLLWFCCFWFGKTPRSKKITLRKSDFTLQWKGARTCFFAGVGPSKWRHSWGVRILTVGHDKLINQHFWGIVWGLSPCFRTAQLQAKGRLHDGQNVEDSWTFQESCRVTRWWISKIFYFYYLPQLGEDQLLDSIFFQMGWFNHNLSTGLFFCVPFWMPSTPGIKKNRCVLKHVSLELPSFTWCQLKKHKNHVGRVQNTLTRGPSWTLKVLQSNMAMAR